MHREFPPQNFICILTIWLLLYSCFFFLWLGKFFFTTLNKRFLILITTIHHHCQSPIISLFNRLIGKKLLDGVTHITMTKFNSPFIKQTSFEVDYAPTHITKWKSQRTGLQLTYINQPSPIVNGYFAVATEIFDSSGAPHTLEHLIFMGSKKFPYKGLLDNLGNRLYSSTNAWTAVDQTVYTLRTAGWEGFKTLLPIYLDHLINPTLTDEACLTEVYHIDGKGEEKGVVFSEMQGMENQSWFILYKKMQETLYDKNSGYSSETGGLMSELRHLTSDKIREFHKSMYRPENLCVIITGSIDQDELLEIMTEFDNELPSSTNMGTFKRPFVDSKHDEPLEEVIVKEVEFPENDETIGELSISWIGPVCNDTLTNLAVDMVGAYFSDSPISIFNKNLIEIEHPLATEVYYDTDDFYRTALNFNFGGVPTENLQELDTKIKQLLKEQTTPNKIELEYMKQIIEQQKLKFIANVENSASLFSEMATLEFIYGATDGSDLSKWTKDLKEFEILMDWTLEQWSQLIDTFFVQNKSATILGKPSSKLNESMKLQNKQILEDIKTKYGEAKLADLQLKLEAAQKINDKPIPDELITQFPAPDPLKISFIHTKSYKAGNIKNGIVDNSTNQYIDNDDISKLLQKDTPTTDFPLFIHFEHFKSQFVTIQLVMSSKTIDGNLLSYMSVMEEIFSLSIEIPKEDGSVEYIPYEKVIADINRDLIEHQLDNGFDDQFLELITVKIKFEIKNYQKAINWLYNVTNHVKFEMNRIRIIIEKIINSLPEKKRNDELMMHSSQCRHLFNENSLRKAQDSIYTESFYKNLLEKIDNQDNGFEEIEKDLNKFKQQLFQLDNIKVIILGDVTKLKNPVSSWNRFINPPPPRPTTTKTSSKIIPFKDLPKSYQYRSSLGESCHGEAFVVNIPSADSTHLTSITKIPHGNYLDEDVFRIALATELLTAMEGPFWKAIRGAGLAYGVHMNRNIETGYLSFVIYRGSDCIQSWCKAKTIIEQYINGELLVDELSISNAINSLINELINNHNNNQYNTAVAKISDNIFKNRGPNYIEFFIKKLHKFKNNGNYQDEIIYILKKYFIRLFDANHSTMFTSLPTDKIETVAGFFNKQGYNINVEDIGSEEYSEEEEEEGEEYSGSEGEGNESD